VAQWTAIAAGIPPAAAAEFAAALAKIGDAGLGVVCKLPRINHLNLYATKVTNAGLAERLSGTSCRNLVVSGSQVTAAKLELLRAKFPGVKIIGADLKLP